MGKMFRRKTMKRTKNRRTTRGKSMKGRGPSQSSLRREEEKRQQMAREVEEAQRIASENFNQRVRSWSYPHHGPYQPYIDWCRQQYQLECIPPSWRQGSMDNEASREFDENMRL
jgi:hypothetical protein